MRDVNLRDSQNLKDSATQLLRSWSGALVTQQLNAQKVEVILDLDHSFLGQDGYKSSF